MQVPLDREQQKRKHNATIERILIQEFEILAENVTDILIALELTEFAEGRDVFTDTKP